MVRKGWNFQQDIDRREKRNEEDGKPGNELDGRERASRREAKRAQHEISYDIHHGCGDDLVERILDEATEPAPEEAFHFRHDKKWNENRSHEHANRSGDEAVSDDLNRYGLRSSQQNGHNDVYGGSQKISPARVVHARFEISA